MATIVIPTKGLKHCLFRGGRGHFAQKKRGNFTKRRKKMCETGVKGKIWTENKRKTMKFTSRIFWKKKKKKKKKGNLHPCNKSRRLHGVEKSLFAIRPHYYNYHCYHIG